MCKGRCNETLKIKQLHIQNGNGQVKKRAKFLKVNQLSITYNKTFDKSFVRKSGAGRGHSLLSASGNDNEDGLKFGNIIGSGILQK